jgi:hypothetical protein
MKRWQRPTGEMWIVKNYADPSRRFGFEGYSFNSQYNLLPMAMLAIAYLRADDSIAEYPAPAESAAYVFDLRETFHHVAAAAGGYYALIDTAADPHYGSTGLQRVHRAGVALSPLSDTPGPKSAYGPADEKPRFALAPGIEWKDSQAGPWRSLAQFPVHHIETRARKGSANPPKNESLPAHVAAVDLKITGQSSDRVAFTLNYQLQGDDARPVEETYALSAAGVEGTAHIAGDTPPVACRVVFPALIFDGARPTDIAFDGNKLTITRKGGKLTWEIDAPIQLQLTGPATVTHNGYVRAVAAELPAGVREVKWKLTLEPETASR